MPHHNLPMAILVALLCTTTSACVEYTDTCSPMDLDSYLVECAQGCQLVQSCDRYNVLTASTKLNVDICSECLQSEAALGSCRDCVLQSSQESCREFLATTLDMNCLDQ